MNAAPTAVGMPVKNQRLDLFTSAIESFTRVESNEPYKLCCTLYSSTPVQSSLDTIRTTYL